MYEGRTTASDCMCFTSTETSAFLQRHDPSTMYTAVSSAMVTESRWIAGPMKQFEPIEQSRSLHLALKWLLCPMRDCV